MNDLSAAIPTGEPERLKALVEGRDCRECGQQLDSGGAKKVPVEAANGAQAQ